MTVQAEVAGPEHLVVDTGPLGHLAEAGWLPVLSTVAGSRTVTIPDAVEDELRRGACTNPHLLDVLDCPWIRRHTLSTDEEMAAFDRFSSRIVVGDRNVGEAAVLAMAQVHGCLAVIDDSAGRRAAHAAGVGLRPTLALFCEAIRGDLLTVSMVSELTDHLIGTRYRLPFCAGGFECWAKMHGLLSPEEDLTPRPGTD